MAWIMNSSELTDEIKSRHEEWEELKPCPCCGAKAEERQRDDCAKVACSAKLCKIVSAATMADARYVWNHEGRFTDPRK